MKLSAKFIIFCMVGFGAFLIDWSFFNLFYWLGLGFVISVTLGTGISMIFNFSINRNFTFGARGFMISRQILRWLSVYFFAFLSRVAFGKLILTIVPETALTANLAYLAGIAIAIPIDFLGSLLWAFKKEDKLRIKPRDVHVYEDFKNSSKVVKI